MDHDPQLTTPFAGRSGRLRQAVVLGWGALCALLTACGGADPAEDLRRSPLAATTTSSASVTYQRDDLYRFFAVAFGAAPGVTYMGQLVEAADAGMSIKAIVNVFTTKPQFLETYPTSLTNQEYAQKLVDNVVGTSATAAAKAEAVADIVAALSLPNWTRGDITYAIFNNLAKKPADDAKWAGTAKKLANQVAYAKYFTEVMKVDSIYLATLRAVVKDVTESTPAAGDLTAAINLAVEPTRFKLTTASSYTMGYAGMLGCGAALCINSIDLRNVSASFGGDGQLLSYTNLANPTREALSVGSASVTELGGNADLSWGRWNGGTLAGTYFTQSFTTTGLKSNNGFHYVIGLNTVALPTSGRADYTAIAATMPTRTTTGVNPAPGLVNLAASKLTVDFSTAKVGFELALSYPAYQDAAFLKMALKTDGGAANPAASKFVFGPGFSGMRAAYGEGTDLLQITFDEVDVTRSYGSRTRAYILPFGVNAAHLALIFYGGFGDAGIVIFRKSA